MKKIIIAAAVLMLAACSKNENKVMDNWDGEIRLSSGVSVQTRGGFSPDEQIAENEQIGIYVSKVDDEPIASYGYTNISAKADGSGNFNDYSSTMYYPQSGKDVKISAYHPFNNGTNDEYDFTVETDQSDVSNYLKSDLLYSAEATFARSKTAHSLTFTHKLSKITCTLTAGDGISSVANATVEMVNPEKAVKFNRTTGALITATTSVKGNVKLGTYGAIIAPQTINRGDQLLKVTLSADAGGGVFYYTTDAEIQFESGNLYKYGITVKATGLTITSTISQWENIAGNNKTGDATME